MKIMKLFRNPLKRKILGGFILVEKDLGKLKSKYENALAILKLWEEELKLKNEVNEGRVNSKVKMIGQESMAQNDKKRQSDE